MRTANYLRKQSSEEINPFAKEASDQQHTILQSIFLHLLPGVLFVPVFLLTVRLTDNLGLPKHIAPFLITALVVLTGFELGFLLYQGKKLNGYLSLQGVILYRQPMARREYIYLGLPTLMWAIFVFMVIAPPVDNFFIENYFSWLPESFFQTTFIDNLNEYSQGTLITTGVITIILIGIIGPAVEELYFRGYLLPRIPVKGAWAPAINILLFSLYHLWTPWQNITRILAMTPLYYMVWRKKNVYFGIIWHVTANILSAAAFTATILGVT